MIVADCSALAACIFAGSNPNDPARVLTTSSCVVVPEVADAEFVSVLRKMERLRQIDAGRALTALRDYRAMSIVRFSISDLLEDVWLLRHNLTAYDASYLVLAMTLDLPLYTRDARMAAGAKAQKIVLI